MHLADADSYFKHIGSTCGVKVNFGYVYHQEGHAQRADQAQQLGVSRFFRHDEVHFFRQDTDAYLSQIAIRYGCILRQGIAVKSVDIDAQKGVTAFAADGSEFRARYIVDATGYRSVLADKFKLRQEPPALKHHSRSVFTHMIDVRPYDDVSDARKYHHLETRWFDGPLHHLFDGGWIWVIPFNNKEGSTNQICSVGLNLDPRCFPKTDKPPEDEFNDVLRRFPEIGRQFEGAKPIREWASTDRLQYSSSSTVGDRWCLMSHAAGFVDPFYSRGLVNSMDIIHAFAPRFMKAVKDGDFSRTRFEPVEILQDKIIRHNDELVDCSYISFRDYAVWNAYLRIWILGTYGSEAALYTALKTFRDKGDAEALGVFDSPDCPGLLCPVGTWFRDLFDAVTPVVLAYERREIGAAETAAAIFRAIRTAQYSGSYWQHHSVAQYLEKLGSPDERDLFNRPQFEERRRRAGAVDPREDLAS